MQPRELRFLDRNKDGSVRVDIPPADDEHFREALEIYRNSLGSAWLSGGLGGVPGD